MIARAQAAGLTHALCILAAENEPRRNRAGDASDPGLAGASGLASASIRIRRDSSAAAKPMSWRWCAGPSPPMPDARALGEIGLDYHYDFAPEDVQQAVFRRQLRLARELGLPIIIHTREAEDDTHRDPPRGKRTARFRASCTASPARRGWPRKRSRLACTSRSPASSPFRKAPNVREIVPIVPADRLLCETDSPYLAPTPHRGKRNEPAWVVRVAEELASLRGVAA